MTEKAKRNGTTSAKYCSHGCRNRKPGPLDEKVEDCFVKLLEQNSPVSCEEVQVAMFGTESDQAKHDSQLDADEPVDSSTLNSSEQRQQEGQRRAERREMVRRAARRGVVFGFRTESIPDGRKCEALQKGRVVEPSFAKGDFAVRWRS